MIISLDHVGISVADMERALGFYRDLLGMEVLADSAFSGELLDQLMDLPQVAGRFVLVQHPQSNFRLELFEFANPAPKSTDGERPVCNHGLTHLCIEVSELDEEYERLAAAGVRFHTAPILFPSGHKSTYGRDPDGNVFELWQPRDSVD